MSSWRSPGTEDVAVLFSLLATSSPHIMSIDPVDDQAAGAKPYPDTNERERYPAAHGIVTCNAYPLSLSPSLNPAASQSRHDRSPASSHRVYNKKRLRGGRAFQVPVQPHHHRLLAPPDRAAQCLSPTLVMGDAREPPVINGLRQGGGTQGDGWVPVTGSPDGATSTESWSLFSSTSSLTDDDETDDATSSAPARRSVSSSSSSSLTSSQSLSDKMQTDGGATQGPLYELSTMLDHLPALRTGLSKYYRGRSQSFTSLAGVSCVEDLVKKTTPYIMRTKASRCYATALGAKNQLSKKIAKKVQSSPDRLLPRDRSTSLLRSSAKPPAYHGKRELYRC